MPKRKCKCGEHLKCCHQTIDLGSLKFSEDETKKAFQGLADVVLDIRYSIMHGERYELAIVDGNVVLRDSVAKFLYHFLEVYFKEAEGLSLEAYYAGSCFDDRDLTIGAEMLGLQSKIINKSTVSLLFEGKEIGSQRARRESRKMLKEIDATNRNTFLIHGVGKGREYIIVTFYLCRCRGKKKPTKKKK